jgi:hypothetical protein
MALRYDNMSVPETFKSIYQSVQVRTYPSATDPACLSGPYLPSSDHPLQTFVETAYQVGKTGVIVAYTFVWGLLLMLWNTLESFADFLGASANFVICELEGGPARVQCLGQTREFALG